MESQDKGRYVQFESFEVDLRSGELHRDGQKIHLQDQPFHVLAVLLRRAGELVTRDELRKEVWPADTFLEFDHALNTAIKKIRIALSDDAVSPRYVQTIPKRGYRWIAPIAFMQAGPSIFGATMQRAWRERFRDFALGAFFALLLSGFSHPCGIAGIGRQVRDRRNRGQGSFQRQVDRDSAWDIHAKLVRVLYAISGASSSTRRADDRATPMPRPAVQ
jgi:DNA-binding winged helix-turn-helix (wHTH) protein